MIKCHLSKLMGERRLKIADVARLTGLHRNTVTLLYNETASRVDLDAMDRLCALLKCQVADLFEYIPQMSSASDAVKHGDASH
ncbi:helix-turn-helix transcriptional regulator [Thiomonas sp.]|uniref:helix-turn-helix domain-containing protein n=1 Tax=Thiomonas sp. TaxID=2047785 RepID=UPI00261ED9CD|nr:helix-turn-helix transcriptional regulator [Thiomonas sp.]